MAMRNIREVLPIVLPDILPTTLPSTPPTTWISTLKGDTGNIGPQGLPGNDGQNGYTPVKGIDYFDGNPGIPGSDANVTLHESTFNHLNIHTPGSDNQDLSGLQPKETGKGLSTNDFLTVDKNKLDGLTNYTHPSTHLPSIINQDVSNRFVTDTEKGIWNGKQDALGFTPVNTNDSRLNDARTPLTHSHVAGDITGTAVVTNDARLSDARNPLTHSHPQSDITGLVTALTDKEPANVNIQAHVISAHAPSTAQKNSDITKAEIEAKLTGEISTHTHAGGGTNIAEFSINVQALTSSPTDSQTVYFGMLPKAPTTTANISKIYIRKTCTLKHAEIYCYSGTAGSNEAWSLYVRKNNTADTLIATLNVATSERIFSNTAINISLIAGDYIEIKGIQPAWGTNPLTCIYGGYLYFE